MNLRQLRCFIAVAEELHFGRAAERLHIEQSPLSRIIKKLESDIDVILFERTSRGTRLTWAGKVFLDDAKRMILAFEQAKANAKSAAAGYRGTLRIALSDGIARIHLSALLALCREEEPEVEIRLFETAFPQNVKGLHEDLYDAGFALADEVDDGIIAEPVWRDPIVVAVPVRHPLLAYKRVPLREVMTYPLVLCHPEVCEGCSRQLEQLLRSVDAQPVVVERVTSHDLMLALVAAGYGIGFSSTAHLGACNYADVVARPLAGSSSVLTTYLLRSDGEPSEQLSNFIGRTNRVGG
ncbi:LysR family transcriptional regulator [Azoarcus communis]|uniref:LysR family transcriptional regulator n=1 Tax=Parazoarcus communis TaxID=41977 RepID=UPI0014595209|nr:LysR family transcriptional regulator [Parazoarcus communis]NMG49846.1 LysR family transcriptional regulator [Parazoarcus communis]